MNDRVPKNVLIVDDHPVVRAGLRQFIDAQEWLQICGEAGTAEEALSMVPEALPDLILADLSLPDKSGIEMIRELKKNGHDDATTMIVSSHDESSHALRAIEAGALGYVMKEAAGSLLIDAIKKVLGGQVYLSPSMTAQVEAMLDDAQDREEYVLADTLEGAARKVFQLIGQGKSSARIAEILQISDAIVESYLSTIQDRLALENRAALVRKAVGWVAGQPVFDREFLRNLVRQDLQAPDQSTPGPSNSI